MCTIIILKNHSPHYPLIIAANRDEQYARPSTLPRVIVKDTKAVGGIDLLLGGSWGGVLPNGFIAALTNHEVPENNGRKYITRGQVILDLLTSPRNIKPLVMKEHKNYKPFNLLVGNSKLLNIFKFRKNKIPVLEEVPNGIVGLVDSNEKGTECLKEEKIYKLLQGIEALNWAGTIKRLHEVLSNHTKPNPVCVHTENYGTVSSFIWAISRNGLEHYLYTDGAPCKSNLLRY